MEYIFIAITFVSLAINILLIIKFLQLTADVSAILKLLQKRLPDVDIQAESNSTALTFAPPTSLQKGMKVQIDGAGICIFEGKWDGCWCFYPQDTTTPIKSPYLVDGADRYLKLPAVALTSVHPL